MNKNINLLEKYLNVLLQLLKLLIARNSLILVQTLQNNFGLIWDDVVGVSGGDAIRYVLPVLWMTPIF